MEKDLSEFEKDIGFSFQDKRNIYQALTHRSYLNENPHHPYENNERLEFLGDAVLELVVTEFLYKKYPNPEGDLTSWRAALVNAKTLAEIAEKLNFNDFLLLSRGEKKDVGRARQYILANTMESIIGAIYIDSGYDMAKKFIESHIIIMLDSVISGRTYKDAKSSFQEIAQEKLSITPAYEVLEEWGPDHAKNFRIGVFLGKDLVAEGEGHSKQDAQQEAAKNGLKKMNW